MRSKAHSLRIAFGSNLPPTDHSARYKSSGIFLLVWMNGLFCVLLKGRRWKKYFLYLFLFYWHGYEGCICMEGSTLPHHRLETLLKSYFHSLCSLGCRHHLLGIF